MPMINQPHSSWAEVYDIAYQRSFGDFYTRLTDATVDSGLVTVACSEMENFRGEMHFDAALCVFTVILYLLEETTLRRSFEAAYASLKPDGILILDIPSERYSAGIREAMPFLSVALP